MRKLFVTVAAGAAVSLLAGGAYAQSAARALLDNTDLSAEDIVTKALQIAASICVYTNENIVVETLSDTDSTGKSKH